MARSRSIKPGFFTNEDLAELPFGCRLMYAGLWCIADREGRIEDRPKRIKGQLFPYDSVDGDKLLQQLADARFILRYEIDGNRYIAIPSFKKHQSPHQKEADSIIPAPDSHQTSTGNSGASQASSLIPSNLVSPPKPPTGGVDAFLVSPPSPEDPPSPPPKPKRDRANLPAWSELRFEELWENRWANTPKQPAKIAWAKCATSPDEANRIIAACKLQSPRLKAEGDRREGGYLHMATWLNQRRYDDELPAPVAVMPSNSEPHYEPAYHRDFVEPEWMREGYDPNA